MKTHVFTIPSDTLLNENMIGQRWGALHAFQRNLSIYLMETLWVESSIAPKTKACAIASKTRKPMTTEDFGADAIGTNMEAYSRDRAFFTTLACITILDQTFFS